MGGSEASLQPFPYIKVKSIIFNEKPVFRNSKKYMENVENRPFSCMIIG